MRIADNIFLFDGIGNSSNLYLMDNQLLVDTGLGISFERIIGEIKEAGLQPEKIKIILNTHCHYDHIGGNNLFKKLTNADVYALEIDAENIETGKNTFYELFGNNFISSKIDRKLKDGEIIKTKNYSFRVIHTPGHTKGSICLYEPKKKILISGDTLFSDSVGRADLTGGNETELINSLKKLQKLDTELLLPGHGNFKKGGVNGLIKNMINFLEEQ
ncbi:MAG: MBL fold metallo-hydrolase [Candidatus Aenigmatarchaeota archaeon]|nr:MAG: MBL fold metallo-hydrolase [Candidatus Aenigmarchaeota archaeon]